jgi:glycosyltransferase involved in cell wall biosynthesis
MRILYDHQMFSIQKFGGITKYFYELFKNLPEEFQYNLSLIFSDNHYLKMGDSLPKVRDILPDRDFRGKHMIRKMLYSINQYNSIRHISSGNFDLFHPTFYNDYFLGVLKKPYIVTVHDLIEFRCLPRFSVDDKSKTQMARVIEKASRIIAISNNTKRDLTEILNINEDKIDVIYHGIDKVKTHNEANEYGNYILFVGRRGFYKNFKVFADSVSPLIKSKKDLRLICIGEPFTYKEAEFLHGLGIAGQTLSMNVSEEKLNDLYFHALVFVYPSLYEGFGMPILEAFANDCPVCLSKSSCFPEIAGNAGAFFDPTDRDSILAAVEKVISDKEFAGKLIEEGREQLKKYSWLSTVQETTDSYKKAILD